MTQAYSPNAIGSVVPIWTGGTGGGGGGGAASVARRAFTDADLIAGVLTFAHALGASYNAVEIYDNVDNKVGDADNTVNVDANTISVELTSFQNAYGGAIPGTWNIVVVGG